MKSSFGKGLGRKSKPIYIIGAPSDVSFFHPRFFFKFQLFIRFDLGGIVEEKRTQLMMPLCPLPIINLVPVYGRVKI